MGEPSHKEAMLNLLLVGVGGAFGAVCRYVLGVRLFNALGPGLPYGTFAANLLGGLLMGVLIGVLALRGGADQERWRLLLGVGVLGGFTTFSSFSLETYLMIERRTYGLAFAYSLASVTFSIGALFLGLFLMRRVLA
jgi:CrcB protein